MSAYTPAFVTDATPSAGEDTTVITGFITPSKIPLYEPLMALGEIVTSGETGNEDIVMEVFDYIDLALTVTTGQVSQEPVVSDGTTIDTTTGETVPVGEVIPPGTVTVPQAYTRRTVVEAGPYALVCTTVSALTNIWNDSKATFMIYDSADYGVNFTLRTPRTVPISMWYGQIAMRASDGAYVGIFVEDKMRNDNPEMQLTIGVVGANPTKGAKKWTRPYLPAAIACDGTKFVLFTEGNRVYHSTDRINWTLKGNLPAPLTMLYSQRTPGGLTGNCTNTPKMLEWLPMAAIWVYKDPSAGLFYTTDPNALSGWTPWWVTIETPAIVGTVYTPRLRDASQASIVPSLIEINANLMYMQIAMEWPNLNPGPYTGWGNFITRYVHKSVDKGITWTVVSTAIWYPAEGMEETSPGVFAVVNHCTNLARRFEPPKNVQITYLPSGVKNISDTKYIHYISDIPNPTGNWYYPAVTSVDCLGFD